MPKYLFFLCLFVFTFLLTCPAQRVETYINHDQLLSTEVLKLSISVKNRRAPSLPDFPEIHGFKKGRTILPRTTRGSRKSYEYAQIYYPHITGEFEIPAIPFYIRNQKLFSKAIKSQVIANEEIDPNFIEDAFDAKLILIKHESKVFAGQAFQLQVGLELAEKDLSKLSIPDLSYFQKKLLDQVDKSSYEVISVPSKELKRQTYIKATDTQMGYLLLGSLFLLPKRTGKLDLPQFSLSLRKRWINKEASKSEIKEEKHIRYYLSPFQTDPQILEVEQLPETDLHLAKIIGQFQIKDSLNKEAYLCGESIKLLIHIEGSGNLRAIPRPILKVPAGFLQYDPVSSLEIIPDLNHLRGRKTFVYELIGAKPGNFVIPPSSMYFFNAANGAYDSTQTDSIRLSIVGEGIPQLLEINVLHNFYRDAFSKSTSTHLAAIPFHQELILGFLLLAIILLGLSFFSPGKRIFNRNKAKIPLSPGLRKLVENKKR